MILNNVITMDRTVRWSLIHAYKFTEAERQHVLSFALRSTNRIERRLGFWEDSKEAKRNARYRNPSERWNPGMQIQRGILNGRYSTVAFW